MWPDKIFNQSVSHEKVQLSIASNARYLYIYIEEFNAFNSCDISVSFEIYYRFTVGIKGLEKLSNLDIFWNNGTMVISEPFY